MAAFIDRFLFQLTELLHVPVLWALFAMVVWTLIGIGIFLRTGMVRIRKPKEAVHAFFKQHEGEIKAILTESPYPDIRLTELVRSWEKKQNGRLDNIRFLIKTGPSIGLVGTLIPMGKALASLSGGDMTAMSGNMLTAFTSTIIGLVCGTIAYLISLKWEKWLHADFLACEVEAETRLRMADSQQMDTAVSSVYNQSL
ncbi:MotA/TolQ/ExbB proton channel family protein [Olivibacter domesticus]|uniref:Outer membrane transport energization protein ExbB n=1 Tax=Olivibacter domesticus TaxID=407022 RepID=A0A1H7JI11_OLID1|nr:MotA/TolQ/ExbB proton channel family protein [Olivibacter domesticus]SEK74054.1 outer membrane transport energization protein ExbB [Olivibacter domesticus]